MFELIQRIPEPLAQQLDLLIAPLAWFPPKSRTRGSGRVRIYLEMRDP